MNLLKKLVMIIVLVSVQAYAADAGAGLGSMRINLIENELQIKTPETGEWGYAAINTPLDVGDEVWVPEGSRAELQLNTGTYIRLDGGTALHILSMDQESSQFYLSQGRAYLYYEAPQGSVIQVDTPDASIRAFDRAAFGIGLSEYYTDVAAYKGYVETENRVGEIRVNAGNMVSLGQDTNGEIASIGYANDWEKWNQGRDERLYAVTSSQSVRYLPSELRTYYSDFDSHGSWVHVHEYGYVWTPRTYIDVGWSPYRHGRWIWRHGEYVWLPYEPWGWAPYHYGRWAHTFGIGWFWVPPPRGSVYWGPGYVGWSRSGSYVGWVPLAPREIYYGRGYYGQYSVNITNVNINEIRYTNVYQNIRVNNGPIVVEHDSFHRSSPKYVHLEYNDIQEKVFHRNHLTPGPPDVKPDKQNLFLSDREIPKEKLPPQKVRVQPVSEMAKMRPLKKTPNESVFNPGTKPATLPVRQADPERIAGKGKPNLEKIQHLPQAQPRTPEGMPPIGKQRQPVQMEQSGSRAGQVPDEYLRKETREMGKAAPGQQRKPLGPPEGGRGSIEKITRPQPSGGEQGRELRMEGKQIHPAGPTQPAGKVDQGRVIRKESSQIQPSQRMQPSTQPQPMPQRQRQPSAQPQPMPQKQWQQPPQPSRKVDEGRVMQREGSQIQPSQRMQPSAQPQPMPQRQRQPSAQPQPMPQKQWQQPPQPSRKVDEGRVMQREGSQIQPSQRMQPSAQPQPMPQKQRQPSAQPQAQRSQPEPPQCGPGQKDQLNPAKCPQNFQNQRKGGGQGR